MQENISRYTGEILYVRDAGDKGFLYKNVDNPSDTITIRFVGGKLKIFKNSEIYEDVKIFKNSDDGKLNTTDPLTENEVNDRRFILILNNRSFKLSTVQYSRKIDMENNISPDDKNKIIEISYRPPTAEGGGKSKIKKFVLGRERIIYKDKKREFIIYSGKKCLCQMHV